MDPFKEFAPLLRARGFHKGWSTRHRDGRVDEWRRFGNRRTLIAQLWSDGRHRMTHAIDGHETTPPTDFTNEAELDRALLHERTRQDGYKKAQP